MAKVAIVTTFQKFDPWYSLTGIVKDQVRMLKEYGNDVFIIVNERFNGDESEFQDPNVKLLKKLPFAHLKDYQNNDPLTEDHQLVAEKTAQAMSEIIDEYGIETVFTHDIVFTGWNKVYAEGLKKLNGKTPGVVWMHWVHSIPTRLSDWWIMAEYGPGHSIIYPNKTDIVRVAENYRTNTSNVKIIPHIKDIRIMFDFDDAACELIDTYPALMQADVVQVYPASSDRFDAKRVQEVMRIFGYIKSMGHSVCLLIANQWATTQQHYANLKEFYNLARSYGLEPGKDFIFSSLFARQDGTQPYKVGVPSKILSQLMMLSNLFIFPTREETFGLVLPEVSLASGALCVLNRSLQMMSEVGGGNTLYFEFGSYTHNHTVEDKDEYLRMVALIIMGRIQQNDGILTRTFMRKKYNMDYLYSHYYAPIMAEARLYV
jgi:hypothetical protein